MAGRANFHADKLGRRAGFDFVSAGAGDDRVGIILGMDVFFHNPLYSIKK